VQLHPTQVTSLGAASSQAGFTVETPGQLPTGLSAQPAIMAVTNGATVNFTFRAQKARQYLDSTGHKDFVLPAKFDGASLQLQVNPAVSLAYLPDGTSPADVQGAVQSVKGKDGASPTNGADPGNPAALNKLMNGSGVLLLESRSPVLSASGVSPDELRDFLLSLPNIPEDVKTQLRAIGDWRTTLPVPVTPGSTLHKVSINGAPGVAGRNGTTNMVLWVNNGIVLAATGPKADEQALIALANSVK
jgi:hypothetical protein